MQLRSIHRNKTGIESWILRKARDRDHRRAQPFVYPYDLGFKENFRQVFNWRETFNVIGDGLVWPVRENCDAYALTREQMEQKQEKRQRTVRYQAVRPYPGSFFPWRFGLRTCLCVPCSDETRMPVATGDYLLVTRWDKYWLYGERLVQKDMPKEERERTRQRRRPRGWFPRSCAYEPFRIEDLWSGKIEQDSDIVRAHFDNIGPEGFDETEEQMEEKKSDEVVPTTPSPAPASKNVRKRKVRQQD